MASEAFSRWSVHVASTKDRADVKKGPLRTNYSFKDNLHVSKAWWQGDRAQDRTAEVSINQNMRTQVVFQLEKRQEKVVTLISLKGVVVNKTRDFETARERCSQSPAQCLALKY